MQNMESWKVEEQLTFTASDFSEGTTATKGLSCFLCEIGCLTTAPFPCPAPCLTCLILIHWGKMKALKMKLFNDLAQSAIQMGSFFRVVICSRRGILNLKNCEGYWKSHVSRVVVRQDYYVCFVTDEDFLVVLQIVLGFSVFSLF